MADITAAQVKELREKTGAGMMQCKSALVEANGNMEEAILILRKKGLAAASKKAGRIAAEGLVHVSIDGSTGIMIEVNWETDFVARNEEFRAFCDEVARTLAANPKADLEARRTAQVARMGENIKIARFHCLEIG